MLASGMCASTVLLMALVPAGGHIVTTTDCYRKTRIFIETILPKMGIMVWFADITFGMMSYPDFLVIGYLLLLVKLLVILLLVIILVTLYAGHNY